MHSQRAFSCRSKSRQIPLRFSSRRRSLSTSDLQSKESTTTPIVQHRKHTLTLNTILETSDNFQGSKEHESTKNDIKVEIIKRAETGPGELQTKDENMDQNVSTILYQDIGKQTDSKIYENTNNTNYEIYI